MRNVTKKARHRIGVRATAAGAAMVLLLAACAGDDDGAAAGDDDANGGGNGDSVDHDEPPTPMVVYGGAGQIEDAVNQHVLPAFEEEFNADVTYVGIGAAEVLGRSLAQRGSPEASLTISNDLTAVSGHREGLWQPLDRDQIPMLDEIRQSAIGNDEHSVSLGSMAIGIAYNPEVFEEEGWDPPTSWEDLFRDEYAGQVVQYDITFGFTPPMLAAWNLHLGGDYENWEPVMDRFRENRDKIGRFAPVAADWEQEFQQGTAVIGMTSSQRAGSAWEAGVPVQFAELPEEGAPALDIHAKIPEGAPEPELAAELLNYLLSPEGQYDYTRTIYYIPVHPDVELPSEVAERIPDFDEVEEFVQVDYGAIDDNLETMTQIWERDIVQN
jgi:putative spermidine/putrescine transport system substrate-binding protein